LGGSVIAKKNISDGSKDLSPLLDEILATVKPAPADAARPLRMQPFNLGYDNYLGRLALGRIHEGTVHAGDAVIVKKLDGTVEAGKVTRIYTFKGTDRQEAAEALAGDIAMIAGIPHVEIGETICLTEDQEALPAISIDEPTISLHFLVNDSPFAGREGKFVTSRHIKERLARELEINVGLKVDFSEREYFTVCGRGELHIAIMLENMRREGYELQVSQPQVIIKEENGEKLEPYEEATVDVRSDLSGTIIEEFGRRKGVLMELKPLENQTRLIFKIPTRGLLGYRSKFTIDTKGEGILTSRVMGFFPYAGEIKKTETGSMVSMVQGKALGYALSNLQERGVLYIEPATDVYKGMVIGNVAKGHDLNVNPTKGKQLTNMRSKSSDEAIQLKPAFKISLERGLEVIMEDEYLEITPKSIRIRKQSF
jgi:GTP-binding protein